jgi:cyanate permease
MYGKWENNDARFPDLGSGWDTGSVFSVAVTVLAHQGGWDETLMVLTPIAVFALLLKMANTRANRAQQVARQAEGQAPGPDDPVTRA